MTPTTLPDWDPPTLSDKDRELAEPVICAWPDFDNIKHQSIDYAALDRDGFAQYLACLEVFDSNVTIAQANAEAAAAALTMYQLAVEAGDKQQNFAEFELTMIDRERRDAVVEAWTYKSLLALVLIAVAL